MNDAVSCCIVSYIIIILYLLFYYLLFSLFIILLFIIFLVYYFTIYYFHCLFHCLFTCLFIYYLFSLLNYYNVNKIELKNMLYTLNKQVSSPKSPSPSPSPLPSPYHIVSWSIRYQVRVYIQHTKHIRINCVLII